MIRCIKRLIYSSILNLLPSISLFSQAINNDSVYKFNNVAGYDTIFSYTLNLVAKDKMLFSDYKVPAYMLQSGNYSIRPIILQWDQYYFSKFKQGKISYPKLKEIVPWIDTSTLLPNDLNNYVSVLIYHTGQNKYLIFDKDRDNDFTNDSVYSFPLQGIKEQSTPNWEQSVATLNLNFDIATKREIKKQNITLFVFPFKSPNLKITGIDDYFF